MTPVAGTGRPIWSESRTKEIIEAHRCKRGPLLPVLLGLQEEFGYVDERALPLVASALNISRAEVHGVLTFYHDLRTVPAGTTVLRICRAEACQSMGAERLAASAAEQLGVGFGETTTDGSVTLEQVFCLGNCALSPAVTVDGRLVGRVDEERLAQLLGAAVSR